MFYQLKSSLSRTETAILSELFKHCPNGISMYSLKRAVFQKTGRDMSDATFSARMSNLKKKLLPYPIEITGKRNTLFSVALKEEDDEKEE